MKKIIIKNKDGSIKNENFSDSMECSKLVRFKDNVFRDCFDFNKLSESYVKVSYSSIRNCVVPLCEDLGRYEQIDKLIEIIKNLKTRDDLKKLIDYICDYENFIIKDKCGKKFLIEYMDNYKSRYFDLFSSVLVNRIIHIYYANLLKKIDCSSVERLFLMKLDGVSSEELLDLVGDKIYDVDVKRYFSLIFSSLLTKRYLNLYEHKCWDNCSNATTSLCPKVRDIVKRDINDYDFINKGYQIYDGNELDSFVVLDCNLYRKEEKKKLTSSELAKVRDIKKALYTAYFDAIDENDALRIQEDLMNRGSLRKSDFLTVGIYRQRKKVTR